LSLEGVSKIFSLLFRTNMLPGEELSY